MSRARRIGRCIYCLTSQGPLNREHVIPAGLNGSWVLHDAICKDCSDITSAFEGKVLGVALLAGRAGLGLRTRHGYPPTEPLEVELDGQFTEICVPVADYPAAILFPLFAPPAYLDGRAYAGGITVNGQWTIQVAGPTVESVAKRYGTKTLRFRTTFEGHSYPRLIAKVAYGVAVADFGLDCIEEAYVLPAILGKSNDIGKWLGCDGETHITNPRFLHGVRMACVNRQIIGRVRLFAQYGAPEYLVVVGRTTMGARPGKFAPPRSH